MKILMSAFSCGPGRGSEPGVGWNMAIAAAQQGHDVTVLTQSEFRTEIEREISAGRVPPNLRFDIFMPAWLERIRDAGVRRGFSSLIWQPVSLVWQFYALAHVRRRYRIADFDLLHHVTFAQIRHPTLLTRLGLPTVLGPLGGGDRIPMRLRKSFPWMPWMQELARDLYNCALRLDPITRTAFRDADLILLRTSAAQIAVPPAYRGKVQIKPGVAISEPVQTRPAARAADEPLRLIYAGHLWHLKGVHLALRALAHARQQGTDATLTIVGDGPACSDLRTLARNLKILPHVTWQGQVPRDVLLATYGSYHAFLFCSLRDAAGSVIVEAWAHGLPVICLALGGPAEMVDSQCGRVVAARWRTEEQCIEEVAYAICQLAADDALRLTLAENALARARGHSWAKTTEGLYADIQTQLRIGKPQQVKSPEHPVGLAMLPIPGHSSNN